MLANIVSMPVLSDKAVKNAAQVAQAVAITALCLSIAYAGGNADFTVATAKLQDWLAGSLGILISLATFATGVMMTVTKHTLMPVAVAASVALAIQIGPSVIGTLLTATI